MIEGSPGPVLGLAASPRIGPFGRSHIFAVYARHDGYPGVSQSHAERRALMDQPRSPPRRGRTRRLGRLSIRFPLRQHPVRGLHEMARHRSDGLGMASPAGEVLVESADVAPGVPAAVQVGHVRGFHERPLQVPIDVRAQPAQRVFPPEVRTRGVVPAQLASRSASGKRLTSPTSSAITTARMKPTPGSVRSYSIAGVGVNTVRIRCSNARTWRSRLSTCSRPRWTPENRPVVDGSETASGASAPSGESILPHRPAGRTWPRSRRSGS